MRVTVVKMLALAFVALAASSGCASAPGAAPGMARSVDDASAGMAVRARMLRSLHDFDRVNVDVVGGLVLLTGRVDTEEARQEAERIAWSAPKVRDVANELQVNTDRRQAFGANDQWVSGQVRARLLADGQVRNATINVQTYDGVVYLLGRARSDGEAQRAASNASLIPGVSRVVSFIRIDPAPAPLDDRPYASPPSQTDEDTGGLLGGPDDLSTGANDREAGLLGGPTDG